LPQNILLALDYTAPGEVHYPHSLSAPLAKVQCTRCSGTPFAVIEVHYLKRIIILIKKGVLRYLSAPSYSIPSSLIGLPIDSIFRQRVHNNLLHTSLIARQTMNASVDLAIRRLSNWSAGEPRAARIMHIVPTMSNARQSG
jgi:hypothetical protein